MFPLRDDAPRHAFPFVTLALIAVNVAVFLYQFALYSSDPAAGEAFALLFGAVPEKLTLALDGRYPIEQGLAPLVTSMFLHGGWGHLLGNMWFLWVFGDNVEDELGHGGYLGFYLACGVLASLAHYASTPLSPVPAVGASGAISGVMGAYVVRFPLARITTLLPIFILFYTIEVPAFVMLGYWFLIQFVSGAAEVGAQGGGVAWWAHIGGFVAGVGLILPKKPKRRARRWRF